MSYFDNEALPNHVSTLVELACLPDNFLSNIKRRLTKYDYTVNAGTGTETHICLKYALKLLLRYSVMCILIYQVVEALEHSTELQGLRQAMDNLGAQLVAIIR